MDEHEKLLLIKIRIEQSQSALSDAEFLLEGKRLSSAVNRVYYAVFYALSAIAIKEGYSTSKHAKLIGWFNKAFVHTGKVESKFGKLIYKVFANREKSDYEFLFSMTREDVVSSLEETKELLEKLKNLLAA